MALLLAVVAEDITAGSKLIGALLSVIIALILYIWKDNKKNAEQKHNDIIILIDTLKEEQDEIKKKQVSHEFQLYALNVAINLIQGKPYNYDSTSPKNQ